MDVLRKLAVKAKVPEFIHIGGETCRAGMTGLSANGKRVEAAMADLMRRNNFLLETDASQTTAEIIRAAGYPVETHRVVTDDGYIMDVHRIPCPGSTRPPVYLQHGILCSSSVWVLQGQGRSLAYLLHDSGYDVWLGNFRGNRYGRSHTSLDPDRNPDAFWDFTFHELGVLDIPAIIDHILQASEQPRVLYVGHSMGTTAFFVAMSERPEYNHKVQAMVALAPVAYLREVRSPLVSFAALVHPQLGVLARLLGIHEFLPQHLPFRLAGRLLYKHLAMAQTISYNVMFAVCGFSSSQLHMDMLPLLPAHVPDGVSIKTLMHFGQIIRKPSFRKFDGGVAHNLKAYGCECPPEYDLSKVTAPVSVFYSEGDWLPAPQDVIALYEALPNKNGRYKIRDVGFSHMDFLLSTSAKPLLYDSVLEVLDEKITPKYQLRRFSIKED